MSSRGWTTAILGLLSLLLLLACAAAEAPAGSAPAESREVEKEAGCSKNADCGKGEYCAKEADDCAGRGSCTPRPEVCLDMYAPVCGCDGKVYSNSCKAAAAGVNVASDGEKCG